MLKALDYSRLRVIKKKIDSGVVSIYLSMRKRAGAELFKASALIP
jgi:hypothetical protein